MAKIILFDADGVLIHSRYFSTYIGERFGVENEKTNAFFERNIKTLLLGKASMAKLLEPHFKEWGIEKTPKEILGEYMQAEIKKDEDMLSFVKSLRKKGMRCYLATNQDKDVISFMEKELGLGNLLDGIFCSSRMKVKKPSNDFFERIFSFLKKTDPALEKKDVLFFDDSKKNVKAAEDFGIRAFLFESKEQIEEMI
jgi:putative hydrolase of the HAD superfamily